MTVVTKKGDRGMTTLPGGQEVPKNHPRLEVCGDLDELGAAASLLIAMLPDNWPQAREMLTQIQNDIYRISSIIAAPGHAGDTRLPDRTREIELQIQFMERNLPPLKEFIRQGGHLSAGWANMARTLCRRAERHLAGLDPACPENVLQYLNRLSDFFFVFGRTCNLKTHTPELFLDGDKK